MKQARTITVIFLLSLAALAFSVPARAMDEAEMQELEEAISRETTFVKEQLPAAERGDTEAIKSIIGLATGEYLWTAEGGERLNEIYLDLMVLHPEQFFGALADSGETNIKIVVQQLLNPVTDKYTNAELKDAVEKGRKKGLDYPFLQELLGFYSTNKPTSSDTP